jgi:chromosome partitioning protein
VITIAVFSQKGGSGKTTIATHGGVLAAERANVALIDADPQASLAKWAKTRPFETPAAAAVDVSRIGAALAECEAAGVDVAIVDCPPHAHLAAARLVEASDFVVIPCRPTRLDLEAVPAAVSIVEAKRKPFVFVLNAVRTQSVKRNDAAREVLESYGPVCPHAISQLEAFATALDDGRAVTEAAPGSTAADQIRAVWAWIFEHQNIEVAA